MKNTTYKNTEIGRIPEDWEVKLLKEVVNITTGGKDTQDRIEDGEFPFFVRSDKIERIDSYSFDGEAVLTSGDGVGVGKIFHHINGKFDFHQRVYAMYDFKNCDGLYFYYYFSENFYQRVMQMTAKSSVDSVRKEMISDMIIPLPPLPEQRAIAQVLSDTDELIQNLKQLIAKKKAIKQGAMQELLTGKKRLDGFEGEWEVKKLGETGRIVTGSTPSTQIKFFWGGEIPWITPTDISRKKFISNSIRQLTLTGLSRTNILPKNTLLVTCIASIGKNAILTKEGACNQQINAIIPNSSFCVNFLYYLMELNKEYLESKAGITATKIISKNIFSEIEFNLPKLPEQTAIAEILSDMDTEIEHLEAQLAKTELLKEGLMQDLLTGKIRLPLKSTA